MQIRRIFLFFFFFFQKSVVTLVLAGITFKIIFRKEVLIKIHIKFAILINLHFCFSLNNPLLVKFRNLDRHLLAPQRESIKYSEDSL